MTEARLDAVSPGRYQLIGELDFDSVSVLADRGRALFSDDGDVQVSLAAVERGNSAGLVLLVDWLREARRRGRNISFTCVPSQLLALARVSGVDELLSL
ncbi:MAG TPA: STAS domain-containing protein [Gammaproteobacteria bacterium]|nr:STAS domain-containing protein [Gammaproteobacteria bacterium]